MKRALLILLSIVFCFIAVSCNDNITDTSIKTGTEVGEKLPSVSVELFDENGLSGEEIDPTNLGKVTVINFWGTWCYYCLKELPYFNEIANEYKDSVCFVAIHSVYSFEENAVDYVRANYKDSSILFAKDTSLENGDDRGYSALGGEGYYPFTIIINDGGIVTYKTSGQISEQLLIYELERALGN